MQPTSPRGSPQSLFYVYQLTLLSIIFGFGIALYSFYLIQNTTGDLPQWIHTLNLSRSIVLLTVFAVGSWLMGFRPLTIILILVASYFIPLLGLVCLISLLVRIRKHIGESGYRLVTFGLRKK